LSVGSGAEESVLGGGEFGVVEIAAAVHGGQLSQLFGDVRRATNTSKDERCMNCPGGVVGG
jgi:hypothetical protein